VPHLTIRVAGNFGPSTGVVRLELGNSTPFSPFSPINPGASAEYRIVFDVPADAEPASVLIVRRPTRSQECVSASEFVVGPEAAR
jgi:hypothetical protein